MTDLKQKITQGIIWSATQNWGTQIFTFLTFLVLSRLLDPKDFGLVALATVFIAFAQIFLDQGFTDAIVQRDQLDQEHLDTAFWTSVLMGGLLTILLIILVEPIAGIFQEPQLAPVLRWLSLAFVFAALSSTQQAILQRQLAFKSLAIRALLSAALGGIVGIGLAFLGFGIWSLVIQNLVNVLVSAIVLWRVSDWRPSLRFSGKHFKDLFLFGLNVVGSKVLDFFNRRSDDFLIGYFLGPTTLGYYTIAYRLLLVLIRLLTSVINTVAFSAFSRLQHDLNQMREAFYTATQYTSLITFPAFIGLSILAPEIIPALFGPNWGPSIPVMQILTLIGILHSVSYFNGSVIKATGKPSWRLGIMFLNAVCNVIGFLFVVRWGIVAVATAYVSIGYLLIPISFVAVHRLIKIDYQTYFSQYKAPLGSSVVMVVVLAGLKYLLGETFGIYLRLLILIPAGILTYLMALRFTAPSLSERILHLVRSLRPKSSFRKI